MALRADKQVQQENLATLLLSEESVKEAKPTKLAAHPGVERGRQGSLGSRLLGGSSAVCMSLYNTRLDWVIWVIW